MSSTGTSSVEGRSLQDSADASDLYLKQSIDDLHVSLFLEPCPVAAGRAADGAAGRHGHGGQLRSLELIHRIIRRRHGRSGVKFLTSQVLSSGKSSNLLHHVPQAGGGGGLTGQPGGMDAADRVFVGGLPYYLNEEQVA